MLRGFVVNAALRLGSLLVITMIAMALVRYGPGFEADERLLDPTLSATSRESIRAGKGLEVDFWGYSKTFLAGAVRGDFGTSHSLGIPVRELISERGGESLRILVAGTLAAWVGACVWAAYSALFGGGFAASAINGLLLCIPTAALAALLFNTGRSPSMILGIALLPKIFQVARGLIREAIKHPAILAAHARGLTRLRILGWHVLPQIAGPLLAWLIASLSLALGALVPIEVICDVPGLGQLAWKASLARDLPVLAALTLLVATIIQFSTGLASLASGLVRGEQA